MVCMGSYGEGWHLMESIIRAAPVKCLQPGEQNCKESAPFHGAELWTVGYILLLRCDALSCHHNLAVAGLALFDQHPHALLERDRFARRVYAFCHTVWVR